MGNVLDRWNYKSTNCYRTIYLSFIYKSLDEATIKEKEAEILGIPLKESFRR